MELAAPVGDGVECPAGTGGGSGRPPTSASGVPRGASKGPDIGGGGLPSGMPLDELPPPRGQTPGVTGAV